MSRHPVALMVVVMLGTGTVQAVEQGTYIEQTMTQQAVAGQPAMEGLQRIWFTDRHIRNQVDFGESASTAIIDLRAGTIVIIPNSDKQYLQMKWADYQRLVAMRLAGAGMNPDKGKTRLTVGDEQRRIGSWHCRRYLFEQDGPIRIKSELWVARDTGLDFGAYMQLMERLGLDKMLGDLAGFVRKIEGYPIEVSIEQDSNGQKYTSTIHVKKIVVGPVDPALFKIPAGYLRIGDETIQAELPQ